MSGTGTFKFKKHDTIGNPSAESDDTFLSSCFVDNGELEQLQDCSNQRGIILGRTGAGKTALLKTLLEEEEKAIELDPNSLALGYISGSTILQFFEALNIKMDLFYQLLWRHVFVVEIIKLHFGLDSEEEKIKFFDNLKYTLQGKKSHLEAFNYLNVWGTKFWETTEDRILEVTKKVETDLQASADVSIHDLIHLGAAGTNKLTEDQRHEITQRGQEVVNRTQMSKLTLLFRALDEDILTDRKRKYFIVVDRLDEDWTDDVTRYRLIKALIETMKIFNSKVRMAKIIIALRADLFERVLTFTTDSGFQDEKYRGLCLPITWQRTSLLNLLNKRINELVRHRYTAQIVTYKDLLPVSVGQKKEKGIDYLLDRTLLRPRDVITFFNICTRHAEGEPRISPQQLLEAEGLHSRERLRSISDEWSIDYPYLRSLCNLLKKRPASFKLRDIQDKDLEDLFLEIFVAGENPKQCEETSQLAAFFDKRIKGSALRVSIAQILYKVGVIGIKTASFRETSWSSSELDIVSIIDINDDATIQVHKMFWRSLGISP
ncbi:MAG TPA: hypothetical protein VK553_03445 [Candidatus Nitrosopolaris rasttigaisensis]|nr:hypothetical protein [Candidatus Nitrosopolaris rasttigaisensis]